MTNNQQVSWKSANWFANWNGITHTRTCYSLLHTHVHTVWSHKPVYYLPSEDTGLNTDLAKALLLTTTYCTESLSFDFNDAMNGHLHQSISINKQEDQANIFSVVGICSNQHTDISKLLYLVYNLSTHQSVDDHMFTQKYMLIANLMNLIFWTFLIIYYIILTQHFWFWLCICRLSSFLVITHIQDPVLGIYLD